MESSVESSVLLATLMSGVQLAHGQGALGGFSFGYTLSGLSSGFRDVDGGAEGLIVLIFLLIVSTVIVSFCAARLRSPARSEEYLRHGGYQPPQLQIYVGSPASHADFIRHGRQHTPIEFPSGAWRGYYTHHQDPTAGANARGLSEFQLSCYPGTDLISGSGVDHVGAYTIVGRFGKFTHRIAFSKTFQRGSLSSEGRVQAGNFGHTVEYRGGFVEGLNAGMRGCWTIRMPGIINDGEFHLWPASVTLGRTVSSTIFEATADHACCVCFERKINTCLKPCNHVAVCDVCARQLPSRACPICRVQISEVQRSDAIDPTPSAPHF